MSASLSDRMLRGVGALVVAFIVLPVVVVIPLSFSDAQYLAFPPPAYSVRWYREVLASDAWLRAGITSLQVALATMVAATGLGTLAALGLVRHRFPGRALMSAFLVSPMVVPFIITGIALYFALGRVGLAGTVPGLIIAHTVLALPRAAVVMTSVLRRADVLLEHAAMTLGARPAAAFFLVTVPLVLPGIVAAAVITFLASFDEIIVTLFVGGPHATTLPKRMWDSLLNDLTPGLAVVSTVLLGLLVILFAVLQACRAVDWSVWRARRREGLPAPAPAAGATLP